MPALSGLFRLHSHTTLSSVPDGMEGLVVGDIARDRGPTSTLSLIHI